MSCFWPRLVRGDWGWGSLERVALTCSQYCTVSLPFFAEKRLHILRNCSSASVSVFGGLLLARIAGGPIGVDKIE